MRSRSAPAKEAYISQHYYILEPYDPPQATLPTSISDFQEFRKVERDTCARACSRFRSEIGIDSTGVTLTWEISLAETFLVMVQHRLRGSASSALGVAPTCNDVSCRLTNYWSELLELLVRGVMVFGGSKRPNRSNGHHDPALC
jgi:hypothetical protein